MAPTTYTATYNGKIVGTRKSPRAYQFAIVIQRDVEAARKAAYEFQPTATDRENFEYEARIANAAPGAPINHGNRHNHPHGDIVLKHTVDQIDRAKAAIVGGWEGYVARKRDIRIEWFQSALAKGDFEPQVHGWSMSARNAQKMANAVGTTLLAIVPAVAKFRAPADAEAA
jgi:hypothetical protein